MFLGNNEQNTKNTNILMNAIAGGVLAAVGDDDDDRGLEVERAPALAVGVDARLHAVDIEDVEGILQRCPEGRQAHALQVLQLVHESRQVLLPAGLQQPHRQTRGDM